MTDKSGEQQLLSVTSGRPTAEEMAAVTAVVSALLATRPQRAASRAAAGPGSAAWLDRAALTRAPLRPGPGSWIRSGRPH